jgi:hypothetical protein
MPNSLQQSIAIGKPFDEFVPSQLADIYIPAATDEIYSLLHPSAKGCKESMPRQWPRFHQKVVDAAEPNLPSFEKQSKCSLHLQNGL